MSRPLVSHPLAPALSGFVLALMARLVLIAMAPWNYNLDGFQRWAGRDHLLVFDWLPATQSIIWLVTALGGDITAARVAMAVVASGAIAAGVMLARKLGGAAAGWCFLPVAVFSPFLAWSVVLYQEGTFLLFLLSALAAALHGRLKLADGLIGALALVRYEGWPFVLLYVVWRRDWRAGVALWGMALWLGLKLVGIEGFEPAPVNLADWEGMDQRFSWAMLGESVVALAEDAWQTGAWALLLAGLLGAVEAVRKRQEGAALLAMMMLGQAGIVVGWMIGLEGVLVRMQVVIGVLAGVFAAALAGRVWQQGRFRAGLVLLLLSAGVGWGRMGHLIAQRNQHSVRWEAALVEEMDACPECEWVVWPRDNFGVKGRHDGCEVIQGLSQRRHGAGFWCAPWLDEVASDEAPPEGAWEARWKRREGYQAAPP